MAGPQAACCLVSGIQSCEMFLVVPGSYNVASESRAEGSQCVSV